MASTDFTALTARLSCLVTDANMTCLPFVFRPAVGVIVRWRAFGTPEAPQSSVSGTVSGVRSRRPELAQTVIRGARLRGIGPHLHDPPADYAKSENDISRFKSTIGLESPNRIWTRFAGSSTPPGTGIAAQSRRNAALEASTGEAGSRLKRLATPSGDAGRQLERLATPSGGAGGRLKLLTTPSGGAGRRLKLLTTPSGGTGRRLESLASFVVAARGRPELHTSISSYRDAPTWFTEFLDDRQQRQRSASLRVLRTT